MNKATQKELKNALVNNDFYKSYCGKHDLVDVLSALLQSGDTYIKGQQKRKQEWYISRVKAHKLVSTYKSEQSIHSEIDLSNSKITKFRANNHDMYFVEYEISNVLYIIA